MSTRSRQPSYPRLAALVLAIAAIAMVSTSTGGARASTAHRCGIFDLGTLNGGAWSQADSSNGGIAVGAAANGTRPDGGNTPLHPVVFVDGRVVDVALDSPVPLMPDELTDWVGQATDVNADGTVIGNVLLADGSIRGFVWRSGDDQPSGHMRLVATLGGQVTFAARFDDSGQFVGVAETPAGEMHAVLWRSASRIVDLGRPGETSEAEDITRGLITLIRNDQLLVRMGGRELPLQPAANGWLPATIHEIANDGTVAGSTGPSGGAIHGTVWRRTDRGYRAVVADLVPGVPQEQQFDDFTSVNDGGEAVGYGFIGDPNVSLRAFAPYWEGRGPLLELPPIAGFGGAFGASAHHISDRGVAVGWSDAVPGEVHATAWVCARRLARPVDPGS